MRRTELHFEDPLTAFKFVTKRYQSICRLSNALGLLKEQKQTIMVGVKSPSTSGEKIIPDQSAKEQRRLTLIEEIDDLETRQMQLDLILDIVDRVIHRLPPQYRFYCFAIYVERKKMTDVIFKDVSDLHRLPSKIKKSMVEALSEDDRTIIEGIFNEDLIDDDFFAITRSITRG